MDLIRFFESSIFRQCWRIENPSILGIMRESNPSCHQDTSNVPGWTVAGKRGTRRGGSTGWPPGFP